MTERDDARDELLRQFQAAIADMQVTDLRQLVSDLSEVGGHGARSAARPDLRRPPLDDVRTFRLRIDLDGAEPPIWRRLDVRSDLTLDVVHQVIQAAFEWSDSHLHRFALGGHPFDRGAQFFLCPFDVEEAEDDGLPAAEVRLDETMQDPGDVLSYVYDYGDGWELTLRLEQVLPAPDVATPASAVDGSRAAPPEDSGGATDAASLAQVVPDPAHFDVDELSEALRSPYLVLHGAGVHPRLVEIVHRLQPLPGGTVLARRAGVVATSKARPSPDEILAGLRPFLWYLGRARGGGIELTPAGYLKPADVEAAARVVPTMDDWIGKNNRESLARPLLQFRASLQSMGLLRKYQGRLLLTRAGASAQRAPERLWDRLAATLVPSAAGFELDATLLLLLAVASSTAGDVDVRPVAEALGHLGWQHRDGSAVDDYEIYRLAAFTTLSNVAGAPASVRGRRKLSPAAVALARSALHRTGGADPDDHVK